MNGLWPFRLWSRVREELLGGSLERSLFADAPPTRADLASKAIVLLVQDTTELDLSSHVAMTGLGPIGNGKGRGLLVQTVVAVLPETRAVLGCLAQHPVVRVPAPPQEPRYQRRHRDQRETDIWMQMVERVGPPASTGLLVHVGDRGADMLAFFRRCRLTQTPFVVRAAQNRLVHADEDAISPSLGSDHALVR